MIPASAATLVSSVKWLRDVDLECVAVTRRLWMVRPFSTFNVSGAENDMLSLRPPSAGKTLIASDVLC